MSDGSPGEGTDERAGVATDGGPTPGATEPSYEEWRRALAEDRTLLGQRCGDCGHETAAPKAACARCGGRDLERIELPRSGTVYSLTTVAVAPADFDGPYDVGLVELGEARVLCRLHDDCEIGDLVDLVGVVEEKLGPAPVFG